MWTIGGDQSINFLVEKWRRCIQKYQRDKVAKAEESRKATSKTYLCTLIALL